MATASGAPARTYSQTDYVDFMHTGPDTLAGRYLRRFWQPIYLAHRLQTGHAIPVQVMSQKFTLYRGESGQVHLLDFRCAHRGTQLSTGWVEGDCLRCFYHGWKYDGSGQCVEMPAEDSSFPPKVKINSYMVEEYLGFIFAYLSDGEPPPFPRRPEFEGDKGLHPSCVPRACNYFQNVENTVDQIHLAFAHGETPPGTTPDHPRNLPLISAEETDYGIVQYGTIPDGTRRVSAYLLMPNCFMDQGVPVYGRKVSGFLRERLPATETPDAGPQVPAMHINVVWRVPVDDENHNQFAWRFLDVTGEAARRYNEMWPERDCIRDAPPTFQELGDAVLAGKMRLADIKEDMLKMIQVQDWIAMVGQGRIADRQRERLGRSDTGIILLRLIWERELRALAAGQPLKKWSWPDNLYRYFPV
jgi:5,5'-dehydrodivanillate O-demethylase oxygenase subunit